MLARGLQLGLVEGGGGRQGGEPPTISNARIEPASLQSGDVATAFAEIGGWPQPETTWLWLLDGAPIGATPSVVVPAAGALACFVRASNAAGETSHEIGPVAVAAPAVAPAFTTAPSTSAPVVRVGETLRFDEGVAYGSPAPTLVGRLTLDGADVTARMEGLAFTPDAVGALAWTVRAENVAGSVEATAVATVEAAPRRQLPEIVGQTHSNTWGSGPKTMTVSRGGETGPLLAVVQTAFTGSALTSVTINGGAPLADADRVTGAAISGQFIRTFIQPVDAGSGDVSVVFTSADGNKVKFGASVYLVKNATGAVFEFESASTVPSGPDDNVVGLDVPDHGIGLFSAYTADGSSAGRGSVIGGDENFEGQYWMSGSLRREARARSTGVGARYDGEPGNRLITSVSLVGVDSVETTRDANATPLVAHGRGLARTLYEGLAAQIDLREFHHGQQGALSYALADGETLPAGLSLVGAHVEGIPTTAAAQTTVDFTVTRDETSESVTISVPITVAAASAAGQLAGVAPIGFTPSGATFTLSSGVYDLQFGATSPTNGHQRYGSIGLSGLTPGVAYEVFARVRYTPGSTATSRAQFRVMQRDVAINYASSETEDDASAWLGIIAKTPLTPVANGVEQTRVVRLVFVPGRTTAAIQIGKFEYLADGAFSVVQAGSVNNDRYVIDGLLVREADWQLAPGALATADAVREGHALFVFDKPRAVRRHVSGIGHTLISPDADPATVERIEPQWAESNNRDPGEYQRHGGAVNWGSLPIEVRYGERGQPFDPRAGSSPSSPIMRYDFLRNADPGYSGGPLIFKAGVGEGVAGSFTKGFVRPDEERLQQQNRAAVWATYTLTVAQSDPGAQAFQPPSAAPTAAHKTTADLVAGWRELIATAPRPAASSETFDHDELMYYLIGDSAATGYFNTPDQRNTPYLHRRDYGEQQSERWNKVFRALMTTPDTTGALTSAQWDAVAIRFLQLGIIVDGNAQAGRWIPNGGGSSNYKAIATFAAVAFDDAAMQARLDGDAAQPRYADDRFISSISSAIIAPGYYPPDYAGGNTQRPRAPFFPWQLGQPQWRNDGVSGSDDDGDTYQSIHSSLSLDGALFVHRLSGAAALWRQNVLDWYDRWFARALPGRLLTSNTRAVPAETIPYWQALRAQGAPVSAHRWGLTDDGTIGAVATDMTGRVWASANANPSANARGWPRLRAWAGGGGLDLRDEFNARLGLLDGAPTNFAITAARDAAGDSVSIPSWVGIADDGYTLEATPPDGALIFLDVTGTNGRGSDVATIAVHVAAPLATAAPTITGTAAPGQTLTASTGTWTASPTGYAYQWLRDGAPIAGATASAYTLTDADRGRGVACRVTAANPYGSNPAIAPAAFVAAETAATNGGDSYLRRGASMGSDTQHFTFAFRGVLPVASSVQRLLHFSGSHMVQVQPTTGTLFVDLRNTALAQIAVFSSAGAVTSDQEQVLVVTYDAVTGAGAVTQNGVAVPGSWTVANTGMMDHTRPAMSFLAAHDGSLDVGAAARVKWLYFSNEARAAADFGTIAAPVDPTTVGSPIALFATPAAIVAGTNAGSGGNFTPTGGNLAVVRAGQAATAFPGALGLGGLTTGAYATTDAPTVRRVTNLNDAGAGSLRAALEDDAPAVVLFDVGGVVALAGNILCGSYKTIMGESAPEPITLRNAGIQIRAGKSQVVVTGLRIRPTDATGSDVSARDALAVWRNDAMLAVPTNILIAYNSFTWAPDECVSTFQATTDITWQDNIFAEGFVSPLHPDNDPLPGERHNFGPYFSGNAYADGPRNLTIARNLFTTFRDRSPGFRFASSTVVAENLVQGWHISGLVDYGTEGSLDIRNNAFEPTGATSFSNKLRAIRVTSGTGTYYVNGNLTPNKGPQADTDYVEDATGGAITIAGSATSAAVYTPTLAAADARTHVLANAGARQGGALDSIDARINAYVAAGGPGVGVPGNTSADVIDWSDYDDFNAALGTAARADVDGDGIVDAYEAAMGVPLGSLHPHAIINAAAQGLDARWNGHRQIAHQAHWMRSGSVDAA